MKGNFKLKVTILLLFLCFCLAKSTWAQGTNCSSLTINAVVQDNSCQGMNSGSIKLSVSGGSGTYIYKWSHKAGGDNLSGLSSGSYFVTVEDSEGCKVERSFAVADQSKIEISADVSEPTSSSSLDGEVLVRISGGTSPFVFFISDYTNPSKVKRYQQDSEVIKNLGEGRYVIDVQDGRGCMATLGLMVRNSLITR